MSKPVFSVRNLEVAFRRPGGLESVVDGVSFDLHSGEITGIVGESGCGKSVTALALMGLIPPTKARVSVNHLQLGGARYPCIGGKAWSGVRGRQMAMIFQEPATALDPVFTIGGQLTRVARRVRQYSREAARLSALDALSSCGFPEPESVFAAYPHELSGGMRQLAMIAMAILAQPKVLIADEPTTALDVSTQALVIDLLRRLARKSGTSILLVTHDLGVAAKCCRNAMVMYCGRLVEVAAYADLFRSPRHPYTSGLLAAVPRIVDGQAVPVSGIPGRVPPLSSLPPGCRFAPRCSHADQACHDRYPPLTELGTGRVACHHPL